MKNFIHLEFNGSGNLTIGHNQDLLYQGIVENFLDLEIHEIQDQNNLWMVNNGHTDLEIGAVEMFDHGRDKLKYLGIFQPNDDRTPWASHWIHTDGIWMLEYGYPVFSWLHKICHYGWLVKPPTY